MQTTPKGWVSGGTSSPFANLKKSKYDFRYCTLCLFSKNITPKGGGTKHLRREHLPLVCVPYIIIKVVWSFKHVLCAAPIEPIFLNFQLTLFTPCGIQWQSQRKEQVWFLLLAWRFSCADALGYYFVTITTTSDEGEGSFGCAFNSVHRVSSSQKS